jgi:hypothetical protein
LALDPLREETHRTLMRLYARQGRLGDALRQYQTCVSVLHGELGVEPAQETRRIYREIVPRRRPHIAPRQARAQARAGAPGPQETLLGSTGHPPLINRQKELAALRESLGRALDRHGGTTVILGEAGIGKTRLAEELVREMQRRGGRALIGHAYETERTLPFAPWVDILRAGLRLYADEIAPRPNPVWQGELAKLLPELGEPRSATIGGNPTRVFEAMAHFLRDLVSTRPLLLVVENLQWADETSLRLFTFLVRRIDAWPLLMVGVVRRELGDRPCRLLEERDGRSSLGSSSVLSRADTASSCAHLRSWDIDPPAAVDLPRCGSGARATVHGVEMRALETGKSPRARPSPMPNECGSHSASTGAPEPRARQIVAPLPRPRSGVRPRRRRARRPARAQITAGVEELSVRKRDPWHRRPLRLRPRQDSRSCAHADLGTPPQSAPRSRGDRDGAAVSP